MKPTYAHERSVAQGRAKTRLVAIYRDIYRALYDEELDLLQVPDSARRRPTRPDRSGT